jgi:hypothetical protein
MCTALELIEKLKTIPPETIISVIEVVESNYDHVSNWVELDLKEYSETWDYMDLKDNQFSTKHEREHSIPTLDLGSS